MPEGISDSAACALLSPAPCHPSLGARAIQAVSTSAAAFFNHFFIIFHLHLLPQKLSVGLMCILWCISNWCLTSLMDGEGKMRDIIIFTGYSLIPLWLIQFPLVGMSHLITVEEGTFYYVFATISFIWTGALHSTFTSCRKSDILDHFVPCKSPLITGILLLCRSSLQKIQSAELH
mgnify:CR=1 FL=1